VLQLLHDSLAGHVGSSQCQLPVVVDLEEVSVTGVYPV
jgi:hypothetical protein